MELDLSGLEEDYNGEEFSLPEFSSLTPKLHSPFIDEDLGVVYHFTAGSIKGTCKNNQYHGKITHPLSHATSHTTASYFKSGILCKDLPFTPKPFDIDHLLTHGPLPIDVDSVKTYFSLFNKIA